jgi:hypothetical protein
LFFAQKVTSVAADQHVYNYSRAARSIRSFSAFPTGCGKHEEEREREREREREEVVVNSERRSEALARGWFVVIEDGK